MSQDTPRMPYEPGRRGSYAKGLAKREEILARALEVIAREGYRGASVKQIADAVGLSQAGLLHYFDSKEELFTAVLHKRDQLDAGANDPSDAFAGRPIDLSLLRDVYIQLVRHNAEVAGLVQLFSRLAVDAADPAHPAHEYFVARGEQLRSTFADTIRAAQSAGRVTDRVDADTLARMFQALSDGIQMQWMIDPTVDMPAAVSALFELIRIDSPEEPGAALM